MNKLSNMKLFAVSGVKNSGKTTLITRILPVLAAHGIKTAVIKHDGHDFEADVPGTDSWKHFQAGAYGTAVFSRTKYQVVKESENLSVEKLLKELEEADLILLEGFKSGPCPKLEVIRKGNSTRSVCTDSFLTAIATDLPREELNTDGRPIPLLDLNDPQAVAAWICGTVGIGAGLSSEVGNITPVPATGFSPCGCRASAKEPSSEGSISVPSLPDEHLMEILVNGTAVVRLLCTKENLKELAAGWLYHEGLLSGPDGVCDVKIRRDGSAAEIQIPDYIPGNSVPVRCTGLGSMILGNPVNLPQYPIKKRCSLSYIRSCAEEMSGKSVHYSATGGMHASALFDAEGLLQFCEDIGRHNTLDKLAGKCLFCEKFPEDALLTVTGRISEDMVKKASRMGVSVIASYTTATRQALTLAERLGITLIGYLKKAVPNVYCVKERIR